MKTVARLVLALVLTWFGSRAFADVKPPNPDLMVKFEMIQGGKPATNYAMAIIQPRENGVRVSPENQGLARSLLRSANDWAVDHYRERYSELPAEKYEEMRKKGINLTFNSSFVMVFKPAEPEKPLATLWLAYPDANGKLELEHTLRWNYPRENPVVAPYAYAGADGSIRSALRLQGGVIELKRFVMDRSTPRDLMTVMLMRTETEDHLSAKSIVEEGPGVLPREYALHCDSKLVPIYMRMGFQPVQEKPIEGDIVMKIDRDSFVENALKWRKKALENSWNFKYEGSGSLDHRLEGDVRLHLHRQVCMNLFTPRG